MKTLDVEQLFDSQDLPWFELFQLDVDRKLAAEWFNTAPHVAMVDGLGDADFWAVEFDCGLKVAFKFLHHGKPTLVAANEPVPQHVQRHLRHWQNNLRENPKEIIERDSKFMLERFAVKMPELTEFNKYQLWRQGDDGNQVRIGEPTSKRDATCWQAELESHKHKQIYWVSRITPSV